MLEIRGNYGSYFPDILPSHLTALGSSTLLLASQVICITNVLFHITNGHLFKFLFPFHIHIIKYSTYDDYTYILHYTEN